MNCPKCGAKTKVKDSRQRTFGWSRRRVCENGHWFTTVEKPLAKPTPQSVVWDRIKKRWRQDEKPKPKEAKPEKPRPSWEGVGEPAEGELQSKFRTHASFNDGQFACLDRYYRKKGDDKRKYCKRCQGREGMCHFGGTVEERRNGKRPQTDYPERWFHSYAEGH